MKLFKTLGLVTLMLCGLTTTTEAQSRVVVRQNGKVVIVVVQVPGPRQERCEPRHRPIPRRVPHSPRRRQSGRHFHVAPRGGHYDPVIHVWRHGCR